jgi:hypothetical protein
MFVADVNDHLPVLMDEMGCFEFWSFYVDIDVMWIYAVGADGHVSSRLCGSFFLAFCGELTGRRLLCCSLIVSF